MKLLYKILMAPAVGIALLIAVGALMLLAMSDQRAALDNVVSERFEMFESSVNVRASLDGAHTRTYRLFTSIRALDEAKIKARTDEILAQVDTAIKLADAQSKRENHAETRAVLTSILNELKGYRKTVIDAIDVGQADVNAAAAMMQAADKAYLAINDKVGTLVKGEKAEMSAVYVDAKARAQSKQWTAVALLCLAVDHQPRDQPADGAPHRHAAARGGGGGGAHRRWRPHGEDRFQRQGRSRANDASLA
jgi:hypothetical protein